MQAELPRRSRIATHRGSPSCFRIGFDFCTSVEIVFGNYKELCVHANHLVFTASQYSSCLSKLHWLACIASVTTADLRRPLIWLRRSRQQRVMAPRLPSSQSVVLHESHVCLCPETAPRSPAEMRVGNPPPQAAQPDLVNSCPSYLGRLAQTLAPVPARSPCFPADPPPLATLPHRRPPTAAAGRRHPHPYVAGRRAMGLPIPIAKLRRAASDSRVSDSLSQVVGGLQPARTASTLRQGPARVSGVPRC
jgi:hypothetical protein